MLLISHENSDSGLAEVDALVQKIRGDVSIYQLISPENHDLEKKRFENSLRQEIAEKTPGNKADVREAVDEIDLDELGSKDLEAVEPENPDFRYESSQDYSREREQIQTARGKVNSSEACSTVSEVYSETLDEMEVLLDIAENVGNQGVVRSASREIYGEPSSRAVEWAVETLENTDSVSEAEEEYSASEMKNSIDSALELLEMNEWSTEYTQKGFVSVNGAKQEIRVPENREFTENEMMRLLVHEVGTHAVRGANGHEQEYEILGSGAGGYHVAEEGLALFMENEAELSDSDLERKYAGRALSVQSVIDGDNFADTYKMNRELGFDHDQSWSLTTRAHRGGSFIKDHVYAEGYRQVKKHLDEESGNLADLMIGKVSVDQGEALGQEGLEPEYSPVALLENIDSLTPESVDTSQVYTDALEKY